MPAGHVSLSILDHNVKQLTPDDVEFSLHLRTKNLAPIFVGSASGLHLFVKPASSAPCWRRLVSGGGYIGPTIQPVNTRF
jgi:hypothetical protein